MDKRQLETALEKYYSGWEQINETGLFDFLCTDGEILNSMRYSIINLKVEIENKFDVNEYPNIYYRDTPPKLCDEYMAQSENIRVSAIQNLNLFKESFKQNIDMAKMNIREKSETENDLKIIKFVEEYQKAIEKDDLISMKWLNRDFMDYYQSMARIFGLPAMNVQEEEVCRKEVEFQMQ